MEGTRQSHASPDTFTAGGGKIICTVIQKVRLKLAVR